MNKKSNNFELKGILDMIIDKFQDIMNLNHFKFKVDGFISKEYQNGMSKIEDELKPTINFIASDKDVKFLNKYVFENIQKHSDDIGNNLRQELSRGLMNKEGKKELIARVKKVFNDKTYTNRIKMVLRTEKVRANSAGAYEGALQAEQSGIKLKKWVDVSLDSTTSPICRVAHSKYGSPEKAIPLNEEFVMKVQNKTTKEQYPPFHPNCRSVVRFVKEKEE